VNSIHSTLYLLAALLLRLPWERVWEFRSIPTSLLALVALLVIAANTRLVGYRWWEAKTYVVDAQFKEMDENPGVFYYAHYPDFSLLSEGKLYESEYAVFVRGIAGWMPTDEMLKSHTPREVKYVIYPKETVSHLVLNAYPGFELRDEQAGWQRYALPEPIATSRDGSQPAQEK